jgi:hypothetical protein
MNGDLPIGCAGRAEPQPIDRCANLRRDRYFYPDHLTNKHADRDPDAVLTRFHPDIGMPVIGLATILYQRLVGTLSLKMKPSIVGLR